MLTLHVPGKELFDSADQSFIDIPATTLRLEHSLVSLSKWESKWHKSFLSNADKLTDDELLDYIKAMTITQKVNPLVYENLDQPTVDRISEYISNPMTATTFGDQNNRPSRQIITSEVIYYWMVSFNIPIECQKWHLNRLLTLIKVCSIEANKHSGKKMSKAELLRRNNQINAERRARLNTSG